MHLHQRKSSHRRVANVSAETKVGFDGGRDFRIVVLTAKLDKIATLVRLTNSSHTKVSPFKEMKRLDGVELLIRTAGCSDRNLVLVVCLPMGGKKE